MSVDEMTEQELEELGLDERPEPTNIHEAMVRIMEHVGYVQKRKSDNNGFGGLKYSFAGEVDLIRAVRPWMVKYQVYMYVSSIVDVQYRDYVTGQNQTLMENYLIRGIVRFTHAPSQTSIEVWSQGEGSDSSDKGSNKAMTGLYKYAIRQSFMIETGDDPDEDRHERSGRQNGQNGRQDAPGNNQQRKNGQNNGNQAQKAPQNGTQQTAAAAQTASASQTSGQAEPKAEDKKDTAPAGTDVPGAATDGKVASNGGTGSPGKVTRPYPPETLKAGYEKALEKNRKAKVKQGLNDYPNLEMSIDNALGLSGVEVQAWLEFLTGKSFLEDLKEDDAAVVTLYSMIKPTMGPNGIAPIAEAVTEIKQAAAAAKIKA